MVDTFSGVTIYGNWDDWYLPNEDDASEHSNKGYEDDTPIYYHE